MKTKSFTSEQVGEWLAKNEMFSTYEERRIKFAAVRNFFDAYEDREFWKEACEFARTRMNNK